MAGIIVSALIGSVIMFLVALLLIRRRRNHDRLARAHESFGPGISPKRAKNGGRHAPRPSALPFLGALRRSGDTVSGTSGRSIGSRLAIAIPGRREKEPFSASDREKGLSGEVANEKTYGNSNAFGSGQYLPPVDLDISTPLLDSDPFADSHSTTILPTLLPHVSFESQHKDTGYPVPAPAPQTVLPVQLRVVPDPDDPFWTPDDLLPPAMRTSEIRRATAAAAAALTSVDTGKDTDTDSLSSDITVKARPQTDPFADDETPRPALIDEPGTPGQRSETGQNKPGYVSWVTASGWSYGYSSPPSTATVSRPMTRTIDATILPDFDKSELETDDMRSSAMRSFEMDGGNGTGADREAFAAVARLSGFSLGSDMTMEAQTETGSDAGHERMSVASYKSSGTQSTTSKVQVCITSFVSL